MRTRVAVLVAMTAAVLGGRVAGADAHALLTSSAPADGAVAAAAPARVTLRFDASVVRSRAEVLLRTPDGAAKPVVVSPGGGATREITAALPALPPGGYELDWKAIGYDDLHATAGSIVFTVAPAGAAGAPVPPVRRSKAAATRPAAAEAALRFARSIGIAVAVGALLLALAAMPAGAPAADRVRLACLVRAGAAVAMGAGAALFAVQAAATGSDAAWWWRVATATGFGRSILIAEGALAVLAVLAPRAVGGGRAARAASAVMVVELAVAEALAGHADAAAGGGAGLVVATAVHIIAASGWAGGVIGLALLAAGARRRSGRLPDDLHAGDTLDGVLRARAKAFGVVAAVSVAATAASGLLLAGGSVASPHDLWATTYGRVLLLKTAVFLTCGALGLANAAALRPSGGRAAARMARRASRMRRGVRAEAAALAAVLALAGTLAATPPPGPDSVGRAAPATTGRQGAVAPASRAPVVPYASAAAADLVLTASTVAGRPDAVALVVVDTRRPAPAPVTGVDVAWNRGTASRARRVATRRFVLPVTACGPAGLEMTVHRRGLPPARAALRWPGTCPRAAR